MGSLQIIKRNKKDPGGKPGSHKPGSAVWCAEVKETALDRALLTSEAVQLSSADVAQLMKVRRGLADKRRVNAKVRWVDPDRWKEDVPKNDDHPKAA